MFGIFKKSFFAAIVTASIIAFSTPAHAVVIDFANYAEVNDEASVGETKPASYDNPLPTDANVPVVGLLLSATGGVPYLDAFSGGRRAGLGVAAQRMTTLSASRRQTTTSRSAKPSRST